MGPGSPSDEIDPYDEHRGESAYIVAVAAHLTDHEDAELEQGLDELLQGFSDHGIAGQLRSFNWQCRAGVMTPWFAQN